MLLLAASDIWQRLSYSIFKRAPKQFMQLFTVHGTYMGHVLSIGNVLSANKSQITYDTLHTQLKNFCTQNNFEFL